MVTFQYPIKELPRRLHTLKNMHISLKFEKQELRTINEALLNHMFPVAIVQCPANYSRKLQWWEKVEFEAMSAEEKRPIIDKICKDEVEKVSSIFSHLSRLVAGLGSVEVFFFTEARLQKVYQLEKHFNALEPKHKRKNFGGRMFSPSSYPTKP
jgi:hypothetical protein